VIEAREFADQTVSVTATTTHRDPSLDRRCALFTLLAMGLAIGTGMLAWGPIPLTPSAHTYADGRSLGGLPHGANVLMSLPMLLVGVWGWRAVGHSGWPATLQTPWRLCFACIALSGGLAAAYHLAPGDAGYLAAQAAAAGASILLLCGFLAERVDARFGLALACVVALLVVTLATGMSSLGGTDLRPLLLLQLLPVLLIPAGALGLAGHHTAKADWLVILGLYALARALDVGDAAVMRFSGNAISGHALMHLCLTGVAARLAYRAGASPAAKERGIVQASTSFSTSG
jgi:hypothetical protein